MSTQDFATSETLALDGATILDSGVTLVPASRAVNTTWYRRLGSKPFLTQIWVESGTPGNGWLAEQRAVDLQNARGITRKGSGI